MKATLHCAAAVHARLVSVALPLAGRATLVPVEAVPRLSTAVVTADTVLSVTIVVAAGLSAVLSAGSSAVLPAVLPAAALAVAPTSAAEAALVLGLAVLRVVPVLRVRWRVLVALARARATVLHWRRPRCASALLVVLVVLLVVLLVGMLVVLVVVLVVQIWLGVVALVRLVP